MVSVPKVKSSLFPQCTWRSTSLPSILSEDVYPIQASCASLEQHWFPMALAFPRHGGTVWKADCAEDKRKPLIENHPAVKARILLDGSSKITMIKIITLLNSVSVSCYKFLYTMTLHDSSRSHLVFHRSQTLQKLIIGAAQHWLTPKWGGCSIQRRFLELVVVSTARNWKSAPWQALRHGRQGRLRRYT